MRLKACLTVGWPAGGSPRAKSLHDAASQEPGGRYTEKLREMAADQKAVFGLDELFRRGAAGFGPIKKFIAALAGGGNDQLINCHIDYFAYAFLAKAKNIDLSLPADPESLKDLEAAYLRPWQGRIKRLARFEQLGKSLDEQEKERYLALRPTALRKTARDEWRAMALLLMNGPSTIKEISEDLSLGYTLGPRVLKPLPMRAP